MTMSPQGGPRSRSLRPYTLMLNLVGLRWRLTLYVPNSEPQLTMLLYKFVSNQQVPLKCTKGMTLSWLICVDVLTGSALC